MGWVGFLIFSIQPWNVHKYNLFFFDKRATKITLEYKYMFILSVLVYLKKIIIS